MQKVYWLTSVDGGLQGGLVIILSSLNQWVILARR